MTKKHTNPRVAIAGNAPGGNYITKAKALARMQGVGVHEIDVAHDGGCALLGRGGPCDCDPAVSVRSGTVRQEASIGPELMALATEIATRLGATPANDLPARAIFPGGVIYLGSTELAIDVDSVGALFVSIVGGQTIVEATAIAARPGESREPVQARHRKLREWGARAFGDDIEDHDPAGHLGGAKKPLS
jgi:hypothetical protein